LFAIVLAVVPPQLIGQPPHPAYPEGETRAARVLVAIEIDATGAVKTVTPMPPAQPPFDELAVNAARALRFIPATMNEKPIAVRIQFAFDFTPPERPRPVVGELTGSLRERGTRRKLSGIEIAIGEQTVYTDGDGRFFA